MMSIFDANKVIESELSPKLREALYLKFREQALKLPNNYENNPVAAAIMMLAEVFYEPPVVDQIPEWGSRG